MKTKYKVEIVPVFLVGEEYMPRLEDMKENHVYISEHWEMAIHKCLCGCGGICALTLDDVQGWKLIKHDDGKVSFTPSIGNWSGEKPYHAHYIITKNIGSGSV